MIALVRLLLASLALIGFYVPGNRLYDCRDHKSPVLAPQGCQTITIRPADSRSLRESYGVMFAGIRPVVQNPAP